MLEPISKKKIYEAVSEEITQSILNHDLEEGSRLPTEEELAALFDVGRGSIREAIKNLQMSGVLISKPGLGTYVAEHAIWYINNNKLAELLNNSSNLSELVQVRLVLDPELAAMAAKNPEPEMIKQAQANIESMKTAKDKEEILTYGHAFHLVISEMCGNRILTHFYRSIAEPLAKMRKANFLTFELYNRDIEVHQAILDAIKAANPDQARERMRNHLHEDYLGHL